MTETPSLQFIAVYLPDGHEQFPSDDNINKLNGLLNLAIAKLAELLEHENSEGESFELLFAHSCEPTVPVREMMNVQIIITFEDIPKTKPFCNGYTVRLPIAIKEFEAMPSNLDGKFEANGLEVKTFEWLINCVLHEICHVFGAFHSKQGIMSGPVPLYAEKDRVCLDDFKLIDHLDSHSALIVSRVLSRQTYDNSFANCEYDESEKSFLFQSNCPIDAVFFLKNNEYTNKFYYLSDSWEFKNPMPDDESLWDAVFLVLEHGTIMYFKQSTIRRGGNYDRMHNF